MQKISHLLVYTVCIVLFSASCGLAARSAPADGPDLSKAIFYKPQSKEGATLLTEKEATVLAKKLKPASQGLKSWKDLDYALAQSLSYASKKSGKKRALSFTGLSVTWSKLADTLTHLRKLLPRLDAKPELLAKEFKWYRIGPDFSFTGYYEPTLKASRKKTKQYYYPLYKKPADRKKGVPHFTREEIDRKGALEGRKLEIAWVDSEVDAFFLHVQGSGRLLFPNGSVTHILFAGKNGHPYYSIGRIMKEEGLLPADNINMKSIKEYLRKNPKKRSKLLDQNPSYVFFREASKGPLGAMGRPLTPLVSLATDRRVLPHGTLLFSTVALPDKNGKLNQPFYGLTLPQDTGGAIKGHRVDLFCGPGDIAEHRAGFLDAPGAVYILVKK